MKLEYGLYISLIVGGIAIFLASYLGYLPATPPIYKQYRLSDGSVVSCSVIFGGNCGVLLTDCADGKTYRCQVNVTELDVEKKGDSK